MKIIKHVNTRRIKRREYPESSGPAQDQAGSQTGREDGICPYGRNQYGPNWTRPCIVGMHRESHKPECQQHENAEQNRIHPAPTSCPFRINRQKVPVQPEQYADNG